MMMSSLISSSSVCPGEYIQHHTLSTPPQSTNRQEKNIISKEIVFASRSRNIYAIHSSESLANLLSQIDGYMYAYVCKERAYLQIIPSCRSWYEKKVEGIGKNRGKKAQGIRLRGKYVFLRSTLTCYEYLCPGPDGRPDRGKYEYAK